MTLLGKITMRSVIPTLRGRGRVARGGGCSRSIARTGTRSGRTRSTRKGRQADSMNGKVIPQDRGGRAMIHGGGGVHTALENLVSMEGKGERIQGSVMNKVSSDFGRQHFRKVACNKKQGS